MAHVMYYGKMVSDQIDAYLTNGVADAPLYDGTLVTLGNLVADTTYAATGDVQYDLYEATAAAAGTEVDGIIDYAGISEGEINGNQYKMGDRLYNLQVPAGTNFRVRRLNLHDKFWLGESAFGNNAPTVEGHAAVGTVAGELAPLADGQEFPEGLIVKILAVKDLTTGMRAQGKVYFVEVVQL